MRVATSKSCDICASFAIRESNGGFALAKMIPLRMGGGVGGHTFAADD
jgi:hypothetical protein